MSYTAKKKQADRVTERERAGQSGPWCRASTYVHIPHSVTDSLKHRMEVVQRDRHTQWDRTTVHGMTPGAGEVTETRRSNESHRVPMALLPSGKVGRRRWKAAMPSLMWWMKTYDRMKGDHLGPPPLGQKK